MRISSLQYFQQTTQTLSGAQAKLADLQSQVASGVRVDQASEDPEAFLTAILAQKTIVEAEQYKRNAVVLSSRLNQQDSVLSTLSAALADVRDTTLEAKNGLLGANDRAALAIEVRARADEVLSLLNASDINGDSLFSAAADSRQPLTPDGAINTTQPAQDTSPVVTVGRGVDIATGRINPRLLRDPSDASGQRSLVQMLQVLANSIESGDQTAIDAGLGAVEGASDTTLNARVTVGIRLQRVDEAQVANDTEILEAERVKQNSVGADLAETISTLVQTDTQLRALQTTYAQVAKTSLFDLI